jgi:STE24 endopeptidase
VNAYGVVILTALLLEFGLDVGADTLNLRALDPELPAEFRDIYDPERYRRSQEYTRARTRFGLVVSAANLLLVLGVWSSGGFDRLDRGVRDLGLGSVWTGLLFIGLLGLVRAVVNLPFHWWSTFVIEERFGFNRTTPTTFWRDLVKGLLLAAGLGGPLLAAILWFFLTAGSRAWLWCWLASAAVAVGVQFVAPTWIMPLFNRFTPLAAGALRDGILTYARSVTFPLEGVFVIDGSRRSTKANAFFTGFGRHKRVALFDTLVEKLEPDEVVAVVAHEIGHYKRGHVVTGTVLTVLQAGGMFFLLSLVLDSQGLFAAFFMGVRSVHAGLVFFALLFAPVELALSVLAHALSRRHEFEADRFAAETTGTGERLASGLKRLSADGLSNLTPHPLYVALRYSHPPVLARVHALRRRGT